MAEHKKKAMCFQHYRFLFYPETEKEVEGPAFKNKHCICPYSMLSFNVQMQLFLKEIVLWKVRCKNITKISTQYIYTLSIK